MKIKFIGLIDPCGTGTEGFFGSPDASKTIPTSTVESVWIGKRGGKIDYTWDERNLQFGFAWSTIDPFIITTEFTTTPKGTAVKTYQVSHIHSGYNARVFEDLYEAAKKAGAPLELKKE